MGHLKKKAFSYKYMAANEDETLLLSKQKEKKPLSISISSSISISISRRKSGDHPLRYLQVAANKYPPTPIPQLHNVHKKTPSETDVAA